MKQKTVKINDREITVKELTPRNILDILDGVDEQNIQTTDLVELLNKHLDKAVNLKFEEILDIPPSDLKELYEAFKEVNSIFFDMAGQMGLGQILVRAKEAFDQDVSKLFASLQKPGTQEP